MRPQSIGAAEEEGRYIAESATPESQKRQMVEGARARGRMWRMRRPRRRCVGLSADGRAAQGTEEICDMLLRQWLPVFTEKETDDEVAAYFMQFVANVPEGFDWELDGAAVEAAILRTIDSAPGPDGIP